MKWLNLFQEVLLYVEKSTELENVECDIEENYDGDDLDLNTNIYFSFFPDRFFLTKFWRREWLDPKQPIQNQTIKKKEKNSEIRLLPNLKDTLQDYF